MVAVKYTRTGEADISDSNFRGQVPRKGGGQISREQMPSM